MATVLDLLVGIDKRKDLELWRGSPTVEALVRFLVEAKLILSYCHEIGV